MRHAGRCVAIHSAGLRSWGRGMRERCCLARLNLELRPEVALLPKDQKSLVKFSWASSRASGTMEASTQLRRSWDIQDGLRRHRLRHDPGRNCMAYSECERLQRWPASRRWQSRLLVACRLTRANK